MSKIMVAMAGAPGSGKSTLARQIADEYGMEIVCPDSIRGELFGDEGCQEKGGLVFKIAYERLEEALDDTSVNGAIFDSTGVSRKTRRQLAEIAEDHGAIPIVCWVDTSAEICKEQNARRSRQVPEEVIENMCAKLNNVPPSEEEGYFGVFFPEEIFDALDDLLS